MGRLCDEFGYSFSWQSSQNPKLTKGKKGIACCTENSEPVVAVTTESATPSSERIPSEHCPTRGNFVPEQEVEETMSKLLEPLSEMIIDDEALVRTSPSTETDAGGELQATAEKEHFAGEKGDQRCDIRKDTRARCKNRALIRADGISPPTSLGELIRADYKIYNEPRYDHRNALIVQEGFSNWIQSHLTFRNKNAAETASFLRRFLPPSQKPG